MSLDLMKCKMVSPQEANDTFKIEEYPMLARLQPSGILCVAAIRIGRNCMNHTWLLNDRLISQSDWDSETDYQNWDDLGKQMRVVFPEQIEMKIKRFLETNPQHDGIWLKEEELILADDEFLYISW